MKAVIQRVAQASVSVEGKCVGQIAKGLLVLVGVQKGDQEKDLEYLVRKILALRIFEDDAGMMNLSVRDINGEILIVSQFTLLADCRKGNRPGFDQAEDPEIAQEMLKQFCRRIGEEYRPVEQGRFGAIMEVVLTNVGPVTIILDSIM